MHHASMMWCFLLHLDRYVICDACPQEDHFQLYSDHGLPWPPGDTIDMDGFAFIDKGALSLRQEEIVIFAHKVWPAESEYGFMDVNPPINWLVRAKNDAKQEKLQCPWSPTPRTLVGSAVLVVRISTAHNKIIRPLEPWEYLSFIGWAPGLWRLDCSMPKGRLCSNLAGNAFSAFAAGPLIVDLFHVLAFGVPLVYLSTCRSGRMSSLSLPVCPPACPPASLSLNMSVCRWLLSLSLSLCQPQSLPGPMVDWSPIRITD